MQKGGRNTPSRFMLLKPDYERRPYSPLGSYKDFGPLTHVFWQLKRQNFMTYDVPVVKGFPILPEVILSFQAQGRSFV